ncbi:hypothetical protein BH11MYX1_BH11MYX1_15670 [soil metagenome]
MAVVTPRGGVALPAQAIAIGQGAYDLRLHFEVPRAQLVEWTVACPGVASQGSVGEPFQAYRERRLAQLRAQREQDRRNASAVTSALVGAFVPSATASAHAGPVRVDAEVSPGDAAGAAVAGDPYVQLPPGDVGAGPIDTVVHVVTTAAGACAVTAVADDADVRGGFELIHIRDLAREAEARDVATAIAAGHARAAMTARLVASGADVDFRAKQQAATEAAQTEREQKLHAAAELEATTVQVHVQAEADVELASRARAEASIRAREARRLQIVMEARVRWRLLLISWGADVEYRARMRAQAAGREARSYRIAMEARARWRLLLISWGADVQWRIHQADLRGREELASRARLDAEIEARAAAEARALELSLRARADVRTSLVALGARARPPMPALRIESRGSVPFDGATWIAGHWSWAGAEWVWSAGGWTDQSVAFGAAGGEAAVVVEQPVVVELPAPVVMVAPIVTTTTTTTTVVSQPVRDHRSVTISVPGIPVRAEPVRDHRTSRPTSDPKVRDHRH